VDCCLPYQNTVPDYQAGAVQSSVSKFKTHSSSPGITTHCIQGPYYNTSDSKSILQLGTSCLWNLCADVPQGPVCPVTLNFLRWQFWCFKSGTASPARYCNTHPTEVYAMQPSDTRDIHVMKPCPHGAMPAACQSRVQHSGRSCRHLTGSVRLHQGGLRYPHGHLACLRGGHSPQLWV